MPRDPHAADLRRIRRAIAALDRYEEAIKYDDAIAYRTGRPPSRKREEVRLEEAVNAMRGAAEAIAQRNPPPGSPHARLVEAAHAAFGQPGDHRGCIDPHGFADAFAALFPETE